MTTITQDRVMHEGEEYLNPFGILQPAMTKLFTAVVPSRLVAFRLSELSGSAGAVTLRKVRKNSPSTPAGDYLRNFPIEGQEVYAEMTGKFAPLLLLGAGDSIYGQASTETNYSLIVVTGRTTT